MTITVVSGTPGSGKTTLAANLAVRHPRGVHIETDLFYDFVSHPIDPSSPASARQNEVIGESYSAAASAFDAGGYEVFIDGVIGPWWLDDLRHWLPPFEYVLLHAELATTLNRVEARRQIRQASASPRVVRAMHPQFEREVDAYRRHVIDTTTSTPEEVLATYDARHRSEDFRLD